MLILGPLPFCICIVLQFHYHENIPWWIWFFAIAACVFSNEISVKAKKGA